MQQSPTISYTRIGNAVEYYQKNGFSYTETPWIVSFEAYSQTKPLLRQDFYTLGGYLVASGEQGFIQKILDREAISRHVTVTPCFREEEVFDETHYRHFMKVELIDTSVSKERLQEMINLASTFFEKERKVHTIATSTTNDSFDIIDTLTGVELGSYGIRTLTNGMKFIYGTGLAEPRFNHITQS